MNSKEDVTNIGLLRSVLSKKSKPILIFLIIFIILSYGFVMLSQSREKEEIERKFESYEEKLRQLRKEKEVLVNQMLQQHEAHEKEIKKLKRKLHSYIDKPIIYTYFDYLDAMNEEEKLLELWAESWEYYGWKPVVLDRTVAESHPRFKEWAQKFSQYPSINPKEYELACYYRWIAMAVVDGGFMSDIDVMNYGFRPPSHIAPNFTLHQGHIPSLVSASKEEYERIVNALATFNVNSAIYDYDPNRAHISDMYIFKKLLKQVPPKILSDKFLFKRDKVLSHWSHEIVGGGGLFRINMIPHLRKHPAWSYREGPTYTEEIQEELKKRDL